MQEDRSAQQAHSAFHAAMLMKNCGRYEVLVGRRHRSPSTGTWRMQLSKEPSRIGKIFDPPSGIGMNREPEANRRTFLATAPGQNGKRKNPSRQGLRSELRWHDLR